MATENSLNQQLNPNSPSTKIAKFKALIGFKSGQQASPFSIKEHIRQGLPLFLLWLAALLYWEITFQLNLNGAITGSRFIWFTAMALCGALLFSLLYSLFKPKIGYILSLITAILIAIFYCLQFGYNCMFKVPLMLYSLTKAGDVLQFYEDIIQVVTTNWGGFVLLLLPIVVFAIFKAPYANFYRKFWYNSLAAATIVCYLLTIYALLPALGRDGNSAYTQYHNSSAPLLRQMQLGVIVSSGLDLQELLFPQLATSMADAEGNAASTLYKDFDQKIALSNWFKQDFSEFLLIKAAAGEPDLPTYNTLEFDFEQLAAGAENNTLADMHNYFGSISPTLKNDYTGLFAGDNLIYITAEALSHCVLNYPELFPTITKLATGGFHFSQFYTPIWNVSTSDGEYVACQGILPKKGLWSFAASADNYLPQTMGHQFAALGYPQPLAFHNHTYDYYERDKSHPNLGYQYTGVGNGLNIDEAWPRSDLQMMEQTVPQYIQNERFHTYYMTVSGHLNYNFGGNHQAMANREAVSHLDLSSEAQAYLACNLELEYALTYLVDELTKAGKMNDTVIVLSSDHYPYGLSTAAMAELNGGIAPDNTFELYRNLLLIWQPGLPYQQISKPASSLDIMPTVSNLFGLDFDSRLFMGRDIFADDQSLIIFNSRSFITENGRYNYSNGNIEGDLAAEEVEQINQLIDDKFHYSQLILEQDYYRHLWAAAGRE